MSDARRRSRTHLAMFSIPSESEVPSQERKNFKSSPEIQVICEFSSKKFPLKPRLSVSFHSFLFLPTPGAYTATGEKSLKLPGE